MAGKANPGKRFCDWNSFGISAVENRKKKSKARQVLRLVLMNNVSGYDFFLVSLLLSAEGGGGSTRSPRGVQRVRRSNIDSSGFAKGSALGL